MLESNGCIETAPATWKVLVPGVQSLSSSKPSPVLCLMLLLIVNFPAK